MIKKLFAFFFSTTLLTLLLSVAPKATAATKDFDITISSVYTVEDSGNTKVTQDVTIVNKTAFQFVPSYELHLGTSDIENVSATSNKVSIPHIVKSADGKQSILVTFKERVVGKGKKNIFTVQYETHSIAQKKGSIWEVVVPGITHLSEFKDYSSIIKIPQAFGKPSIIKPQKTISSDSTYTFSKNELGKSGVTMMFGKSQAYSFDLSYHLKNTNLFPITTEIALPPNTSYQDVSITNITPRPTNVVMDDDGNWLASYTLPSQKKVTVRVAGIAVVHSTSRKESLTDSQKRAYLTEKKYWEQGSRVKEITQTTKTPLDIYQYVVSHLSYDYQKVTEKDNRLGATKVFDKNASAVCLEFTDLFVALARSAGIPARAVEGYAYTNDKNLRPLALRQDILHAWPEYYDTAKGAWIMVDPTWANTTKGADYFSSLDFYHFAFVIKGMDSTYPVPAGGYKDNPEIKDIKIAFADESDFKTTSSVQLSSSFPDFSFSGLPAKGKVTVKNTGSTVIIGKKLLVLAEGGKSWEYPIDPVPPYGTKDFTISVPTGNFLTNTTHRLRITLDSAEDFRVFRTGVIPQGSQALVIGGGVFLVSIITITAITIKARRISLSGRKK